MGLITCRDCKREVSDRAAVCPGCGGPLQGTDAGPPGAAKVVTRSGPSKLTRMVALLAAFGLLYVGAQLLVGAVEGGRNKDWSPASVIVVLVMTCVCLGGPAALYLWAIRKPK
jgi:hypothetical protein